MTRISTRRAWTIVSLSAWISSGGCQPDEGLQLVRIDDGCLDRMYADAEARCVAWTDCRPGTYVAGAGTQDRRCEPCEEGAFSAETNAASCEVLTDCGPGEFVLEPGSAERDRTCAVCPNGTFTATANAVACADWSSCEPGERVSVAGTGQGDRECEACAEGSFSTVRNAEQCVTWSSCAPGEVVASVGSATADRTCEGCGSGTFSLVEDAVECAAWSTCVAGRFVSSSPSASADRGCEDCPSGTYTSGDNQSSCLEHGACPAGTVQTAAATSTSAPVCADCVPGEHCPGGDSAAQACAGGEWDDDADPATACVSRTTCIDGELVTEEGSATLDRTCSPCDGGTFAQGPNAEACTAWSSCVPGESVVVEPSATQDRGCAACESGTYTDVTNAASCTLWTECAAGYREHVAGSATADRQCVAWEWVRQAGTWSWDSGNGAAAGSGLAYLGGRADWGAVGGETSAGDADFFVRHYDANGDVQWTRQFGTSEHDSGVGVTVDGSGNVFVIGYTRGTLAGQSNAGGLDGVVRKYDSAGTEKWTRQFGTTLDEYVYAATGDANGNVYVVGYTYGTFGQTNAGDSDAFVRKYNASGTHQWTRLIGSTEQDTPYGVTVDPSGNVLIAGQTGGTLPGATSAGFSDAFVVKLNASGTTQWRRQFGTSGSDIGNSVATDSAGNVYVARSFSSNEIRKYDASGTLKWSIPEPARALAVASDGTLYAAAGVSGQAVVSTYDGGTGDPIGSRSLSASGAVYPSSLHIDTTGVVYLGGIVDGAFPGQTGAGDQDVFLAKLLSP